MTVVAALIGVVGLSAACSSALSQGETELVGTLEATGPNTLFIEGRTITLADDLAMPKDLEVGDQVRVELETDEDRSLTAVAIEVVDDGDLEEEEDRDEEDENEQKAEDDDHSGRGGPGSNGGGGDG